MLMVDWSKRLVEFSMRTIQASEAKTHLPELLDDIERGETLIITRHGRPIARIIPEIDRRAERTEQALANIAQLRKRTGRLSVKDILSARNEGRA